ncbi:2-methylisocitrate lyase (plasmid) [Legionella adelaidensis]|uniref:2-methylisocitrate lyase n=1 Tax=Legionella adelaidensis TaxID=45056 RepID=A0A0W0R253_9GAMM|nr:methylisocitrate lyase [Legionella adelaidensis]KTC65143.1 2-methylisocitrate lyase [Legionella adelaidensis]VEH85035.1 2-methylisocitrate lyase [Legionella adelaidensis]
MSSHPGKLFRRLIQENPPLQVVGTINAYMAMLAADAGIKAIYLSGAGVANAAFGLPDLAMTSLTEVTEEARRITAACDLPLLVDIDTGWGHAFNIARTIRSMENVGVAAVHMEDQINAKRCGHRPNKGIVKKEEMGDRLKAAVDARVNPDFVIMARTDAFASEGLQAAIERSQYYVELGADMIFAEALNSLEDYREFTHNVQVPVLANITEFGKTPLYTRDELQSVGIKLILYPLSAFRAMSYAAVETYKTIVQEGTQKSLIEKMQPRAELYRILKYQEYENKLDQFREHESE